jgi:hypothetical protein
MKPTRIEVGQLWQASYADRPLQVVSVGDEDALLADAERTYEIQAPVWALLNTWTYIPSPKELEDAGQEKLL